MSAFSLVIGSQDHNQVPVEIQIYFEPQASASDPRDEYLDSSPTVTVKTLDDETFSTSSTDLNLMSSVSKDSLVEEADFPDNVSTHSSMSVENPPLPPVTTRIEINPSTSNGSPMRISIKPTPTPRPSSVTSLPTMPRSLHYASSTNESWDTSSEGSTPRESVVTKVRKISGLELISSQRKPGGGEVEEKAIVEQDDGDVQEVSNIADTVNNSTSRYEEEEKLKPVEEELIESGIDNAVNAAPKTSPPRVPPPVAPKPRLSSSSSIKSDDSRGSEDSPKIPPPVAPKTRSLSTKSDDSQGKEDSPSTVSKGPKISAGYERLQAMAKAKNAKPSKIIEKSRSFVSSKTKMFESEEENTFDASKDRRTSTSKFEAGRPFNSSLLPLNERRKSTGSFQQQSSSLTRPKSLFSKGNVSMESSIPEQVSPREETTKSPTRLNSALSPRRASLKESPSSVVFTFSPKQAPKVSAYSTDKPGGEGKMATNSSPFVQKDNVVSHKVTSPSLNKALSPSLPPSKLESRSEDSPVFTPSRRSNSVASLNLSRKSSISSQMSEEVVEDKMRLFDDLLQDAPLPHTATDPADILLWAPVRKDSPSSTITNVSKTESSQSPDSNVEGKKPVAPPRKAPPPVPKKREKDTTQMDDKAQTPTKPLVQEEMILPETKAVDSHLPPAMFKDDGIERKRDEIVQVVNARTVDYQTLLNRSGDSDKSQNIPASQMAAEMLSQMSSVSEERISNQNNALLLKNSLENMDNDTVNIPANNIADLIHEDNTGNEQHIILGQVVSDSENIPASEIASEILDDSFTKTESKVEYNSVNLLNTVEVSMESNIPASKLAEEIAENEINHSVAENSVESNDDMEDRYLSQASEIVQNVIAQISSKPEMFLGQENAPATPGSASPDSSDDEPPPLPGAPPPPIIFRNNSEMLTESAWLDNVLTSDDTTGGEDKGNIEINDVIEEDLIPTVTNISDNQAAVNITSDPVTNEETQQSKKELRNTDLSNLISSQFARVESNLVSQNMAQVINHDIAGEDEELSHVRNESSEPLNSTGESSFQEGDGIRLHSPASVDVLSEDSGMPGDEEFQEVNTDDTISPVVEFRDSEVQEMSTKTTRSNVYASKSPFYDSGLSELSQPNETPQHDSVSDSEHFNDNNVVVNDVSQSRSLSPSPPPPTLPTSPPPPPPTLPTSPPPCVPAAMDSVEDLITSAPSLSVSHSQPSDSLPSSKETSSLGDQLTQTTNNGHPTQAPEEEEAREEIIVVDSKPVHNEIPKDIESTLVNKEEIKSQLYESGASDATTSVKSRRKWCLSSNSSEPSLVLAGAADGAMSMDYASKTLKSALSPEDFVSLLNKANDVLDSMSAPSDVELLVVHIHREGDSIPLGIDLKTDTWHKVSSLKEASPLAKEGSIRVGDWLMAVDNLWFPRVSLMRCLARLTKPKHDTLLVVARCQGTSPPSNLASLEPSNEIRKVSSPIESPVEKARNEPSAQPSNKPPPTQRVNAALETKAVTPKGAPEADPGSEAVDKKAVTPKGAPEADPGSEAEDKKAAPEKGEDGLYSVMMMKGATGVGFCLEGGIGSPKGNVPIIIKRIFKGGPAEKCGQLKVKDEILSVNGMDFTNMRHYEAWNHLKFLDDGEVHFKIRRSED